MIQNNKITISDSVYQYLKDMILSIQLKPGDKINEGDIAKKLGISRTPIREAIRLLANDGIVTMYPNRFAEVSRISDERVAQLGIVRTTLDILAAKLAVLFGSDYDFTKMHELNEECKKASLNNDVAKKIKMNCAFHLELSKISKNLELIAIQQKLYLQIEFIQAFYHDRIEPTIDQYNQHKEIVLALFNRDVDRLIELLLIHEGKFHNLNGNGLKSLRDIQSIYKKL